MDRQSTDGSRQTPAASVAPADPGRRRLLAGGAAALGTAVLGRPRRASAQARDAVGAAVSSEMLTDSIAVVRGPDGNSTVANGSAGLVIVDGGHAAWADALLGAIDAAFPSRPLAGLVNTHWHPEQTGINLALGERGVDIFAHENTRLWLGTEIHQRWSGRSFPALPPAARPTTGFHGPVQREIGGRSVDFRYMLHAHTDGDICAYFPEDNVLVTGGHVSNDGWPVIDWWTGGWIGGMLDGFDTLLGLANADTVIVPARGPVMSTAMLIGQHEMYLTIFDRLQTMLRDALGPDEVVAAGPTAEFDSEFGDPELFVRLAFESMWGHLRDAHDQRMRNIA